MPLEAGLRSVYAAVCLNAHVVLIGKYYLSMEFIGRGKFTRRTSEQTPRQRGLACRRLARPVLASRPHSYDCTEREAHKSIQRRTGHRHDNLRSRHRSLKVLLFGRLSTRATAGTTSRVVRLCVQLAYFRIVLEAVGWCRVGISCSPGYCQRPGHWPSTRSWQSLIFGEAN